MTSIFLAMHLHWQGLVCASWDAIRSHSDIWSDDWDVAEYTSQRSNHASEKHPNAISLNDKSDKRPSRQNEKYSSGKRQCALPFSTIGEESERFRRTDESRDADEKEDIAHGKKSAVEEEEDSQGEEESTGGGEGCADLCILVSIVIVW